MCQFMTTVAQAGEYQYIAYCEHGTIHLGWYSNTFHLRPLDFLRVARLLEQSQTQPDFTEISDAGRCCLLRQQNTPFWPPNLMANGLPHHTATV
jgi:hypothetical protein